MKITSLLPFMIIFIAFISCSDSDCPVNSTDYPRLLDDAISSINQELNSLNGESSLGANMIGFTDLSAGEIYPILSDIVKADSRIVEAAFIDKTGILKYIKPDEYKDSEGADISDQEHVMKLHSTLQPVMSDLFMAVEGFRSLDFAYPIMKDDELAGSLSLLIKPYDFLGNIAEPLISGTDSEIFIAQSDGIVIYDQDEEEIGKNLATDPSYQQYPGLVEVGEKIIQNNEGTAEYSYKKAGSDTDIKKIAYWKTLEFFGAKWRVVVAVPR